MQGFDVGASDLVPERVDWQQLEGRRAPGKGIGRGVQAFSRQTELQVLVARIGGSTVLAAIGAGDSAR